MDWLALLAVVGGTLVPVIVIYLAFKLAERLLRR